MIPKTEVVNILVVDDLPTQRLTVEAALSDVGERVVSVGSGRDALKFLLENDAAVILLDVNMPEMDGFETATLIRQRNKNAHTPIIFLTANADEVQAARGYALGAVDYLICPFPPDVLRTKVGVFVALSRANEQVRREAEQRIALTREQTARAAAEEQSSRLRVLVEIGGVLTRAVDGSPFETELLSLFVPLLADEAGLVFSANGDVPGSSTWSRSKGAGDRPGSLPGVPPPALLDAVSAVLSSGRAERLRDASGGITGIALPLAGRGGVYGALAMVSERRYTNADLELLEVIASRTASVLESRRLYRELEDRDRRKDEFLAMLSHELRNPLGAITTAAQVLQMGTASGDKVERAGAVIARQSYQLSRMLDDLLEVSRVTTGRVQLTREAFDLGDVAARAVEALKTSGRLNSHEISLQAGPVLVEADIARTDQIITNLLVNAVKYTDPGGRIGIEVGSVGSQAFVKVSDNGIGISADLLPRLFEVFVQGRQALDRAQGGLGIGLALVKKLTELQGGTVEACSPGPGQGSTFTVRLPRLMNAKVSLGERRLPRMLPSRLRVLVVDDNADARDMLRTFLELAGHEVHDAVSGPDAVEKARRVLPDLALVDLGLPGFDGLEVAARLRGDLATRGILLVAMTGYGQPDDKRRTLEAGFEAHIVKPVTSEQLNEVISICASRVDEARA
jgi:CheY-like chemotaxis protein/nitrogen-specific signal transduction histidine kinase